MSQPWFPKQHWNLAKLTRFPQARSVMFHRAHCVPQEGGRVQGWESVSCGVLGIPLLENRKVTKCPFHVFDRYEIHIQDFEEC